MNRTWIAGAALGLVLASGAQAQSNRDTPEDAPRARSNAARPDNRTAAMPPALSFDQTVRGSLTAPVDACGAPDPRRPSWSFTVPANTRIQATLTADDFDPTLELGRYKGCTWESLGSNDDGGGAEDGLNSRLTANIREAGTYILRAGAVGDNDGGAFTLRLTRLPAVAAAGAPVPISVGRKAEGRLTDSDATLPGDPSDTSLVDSGRAYRLYALTGRAGDRYQARLESSEFDSFLEVGTMTPLGFAVSASNDDGGEEGDNLNSRLNVDFQGDGTVLLRVSPLNQRAGRYTLTVEPRPATATPAPTRPRG